MEELWKGSRMRSQSLIHDDQQHLGSDRWMLPKSGIGVVQISVTAKRGCKSCEVYLRRYHGGNASAGYLLTSVHDYLL